MLTDNHFRLVIYNQADTITSRDELHSLDGRERHRLEHLLHFVILRKKKKTKLGGSAALGEDLAGVAEDGVARGVCLAVHAQL